MASQGVIKAMKNGKATITVTSTIGKKKATIKVIVGGKSITSVTLSYRSKTLQVGESYVLKTIVKPSKPSVKTLKWSSSNQGVATVSSGKIHAITAGNLQYWITLEIFQKQKNLE